MLVLENKIIFFHAACGHCQAESDMSMSYEHAALLFRGQSLTYTCSACGQINQFDLKVVKHIIDKLPTGKKNHLYKYLDETKNDPISVKEYSTPSSSGLGDNPLIITIIIVIGLFLWFYFQSYSYTQGNINQALTNESDSSSSNLLLVDESKFQLTPKEVKFDYVVNGSHWTLTTTVYGGLNEYLASLPRSISYNSYASPPTSYDFIAQKIDNPYQKKYLDYLGEYIAKMDRTEKEKVLVAVSFVQNIKYDSVSANNNTVTGRYPYEVLYDGIGVCSEKTNLLVYLLRQLGYGTAVFRFAKENHDAVGIKCDSQYAYKNTGYCFIESTSKNIITNSYGDYVGVGKLTSTPEVIKVSDGKTYDAQEDYTDTQRYLILENNHSSAASYSEWIELRKKYGLDETSCDQGKILCNGICYTSTCTTGKLACLSTGLTCIINR